MDFVTFVIDLVIVAWLAAVIVAIVRAWRARSPRLVPLSLEARHRFVTSWYRITAGFVDAPREAVQQADALVLLLHPSIRDDGGEICLPPSSCVVLG